VDADVLAALDGVTQQIGTNAAFPRLRGREEAVLPRGNRKKPGMIWFENDRVIHILKYIQ
jgi:hypothetical protein